MVVSIEWAMVVKLVSISVMGCMEWVHKYWAKAVGVSTDLLAQRQAKVVLIWWPMPVIIGVVEWAMV